MIRIRFSIVILIAMEIIRANPARSGSGFQTTGHFPWRCNLLRFWEAGLGGGWGAGGVGEGRGSFGRRSNSTRRGVPPTPPLLFFSGREDPPTRMGGRWGVPPPGIPGHPDPLTQFWEPAEFQPQHLKRQGNAMPGCCAIGRLTQFRSGGWGVPPPAQYFSGGVGPPSCIGGGRGPPVRQRLLY